CRPAQALGEQLERITVLANVEGSAPASGAGVMEAARQVVEAVETVILGKSEVVRLAVACLLSNGHLLIEDIPGVGKTMLARALSRSIGGVFKRAQFTPDLLPADL